MDRLIFYVSRIVWQIIVSDLLLVLRLATASFILHVYYCRTRHFLGLERLSNSWWTESDLCVLLLLWGDTYCRHLLINSLWLFWGLITLYSFSLILYTSKNFSGLQDNDWCWWSSYRTFRKRWLILFCLNDRLYSSIQRYLLAVMRFFSDCRTTIIILFRITIIACWRIVLI